MVIIVKCKTSYVRYRATRAKMSSFEKSEAEAYRLLVEAYSEAALSGRTCR